MLPEAQNGPAPFGQQTCGLGIAGSIRGDLVRPELGVGFRGLMMLRTAMPEASVYQDGDMRATEQQVRRAAEISLRPRTDSVTESRSVHQAAHLHLGFRVSSAVGTHGRAGLRTARP